MEEQVARVTDGGLAGAQDDAAKLAIPLEDCASGEDQDSGAGGQHQHLSQTDDIGKDFVHRAPAWGTSLSAYP